MAGRGFADDIQRAIEAADRDDLIGWIVDLRGNGGGHMWPMLAGLGPILGEELLGYFIDPLGQLSWWGYSLTSGATSSGHVMQTVTSPYLLERNRPRSCQMKSSPIPPRPCSARSHGCGPGARARA